MKRFSTSQKMNIKVENIDVLLNLSSSPSHSVGIMKISLLLLRMPSSLLCCARDLLDWSWGVVGGLFWNWKLQEDNLPWCSFHAMENLYYLLLILFTPPPPLPSEKYTINNNKIKHENFPLLWCVCCSLA